MKKLILNICLLLFVSQLFSQTITLDDCYMAARKNYPLIKQYDLIEQSKGYNLATAAKGYLPQLSLNARASWQSDVTEFPDAFMVIMNQMGIDGISFPDKDQYRIVLELYQTIWDGGMISAVQKQVKAQSEIDKQRIEVDLYTVNNQINQLYFGILLLDEQLIQNDLFQKELQRNYDRISSYADNGLANQSDLNKIRVEILSRRQAATEMKNSRDAFLMMLSLFIGEKLGDNAVLAKPTDSLSISEEIDRPELKLFDAQLLQFDSRKSGILAKGMPNIGLFAQGAYADPGLNMFNSGFQPYFIGGISLSWNFGRLYSYRDECDNVEVGKKSIEVQREAFLFNLNQKIVKSNSDIEKIRELIKNDDEIILLREQIKAVSEAKVENGTMSINDFLQDYCPGGFGKQNKSLHEMQLLLTLYQLKVEKGK
jgi:outer membrane protein TolC